MTNNFLSLIANPLMNLDHTYRYSGTKLVEMESLSQHIVDTIMLGLKLIDELNWMNKDYEDDILDTREYVMKAIYHDLEEAVTGDIPRPLKYYNDKTLESMREVADIIAHDFFSKQFKSPEPYKEWDNAKCGKEGFILKLVDNLVVVNKVIKEVSLLHNFYMLRVAHEVSQYTRSLLKDVQESSHFNNPEANSYIESVLLGAIDSMNFILNEHKETLESLNIHGQSMI